MLEEKNAVTAASNQQERCYLLAKCDKKHIRSYVFVSQQKLHFLGYFLLNHFPGWRTLLFRKLSEIALGKKSCESQKRWLRFPLKIDLFWICYFFRHFQVLNQCFDNNTLVNTYTFSWIKTHIRQFQTMDNLGQFRLI